MAVFYGYKKLERAEDWKGLAGDDKWVPSRSAYELAFAWHGSGGLPEPIAAALASSDPRLSGLVLRIGLVEKPVFLDTMIGPSMTDLMGFARNGNDEQVVLAVEGKADEPFGLPVWAWLRGDVEKPAAEAPPRRSRLRRLTFLCGHLGLAEESTHKLRYQLLHRTVSAVLEAQLAGATAAVVLIHSFGPCGDENWTDFSEFLSALKISPVEKGRPLGPVQLGKEPRVPTFFMWWTDARDGSPSVPYTNRPYRA